MLADINKHERDDRIAFEEEGHKYTIDGTTASSNGYVSTTTLIHQLFPAFDADHVIAKMRGSRRWPNSQYYGLTDEQIKDMWDSNRDVAASAGTAMHRNLELCCNGLPHETTSKEFQLFNCFRDDHPDLIPYRSEWLIFDEGSRICGSVDMIYTNTAGEYFLCDFKRSKEIRFSNRWQQGCTPMTCGLDDCNFIHYSLQLGVYKAILEKNYGIRISETYILVLHPNQAEYLQIPTASMSKIVSDIFSWRATEPGYAILNKSAPIGN